MRWIYNFFVVYLRLGIQIHMSQSSTSPPSMKKKVLTALLAVVIGHMGVLWAVSNMKVPELKPIEKNPLKVKFLNIVEQTPPPVPAEPIKPKVPPTKPKVEPVPPKPVVKPQVVATTLPTPTKKVVQQDDTQEKLKQQQQKLKLENQRLVDEQKRLDRLKQDQAVKDQQAREQAVRDQAARDQAAREQAARDQAARDQAERDAKTAPRKFSEGDVAWSRKPRLSFTNKDLDNVKRTVVVNITATADGKISNVKVTKSSGLSALDEKVLRAVRGAKFVASKDGRAIYGDLPFELELN